MKRLDIPDNLTAMAYKSIKEYILEGHVTTESRLTEEFLANQLGISKSPIREALNRLEIEGLIRIEPRRGAYLRTYSPAERDELYEVREALEVQVMRTAKITPALIRDLRTSIERQHRHLLARARVEYIQEDVAFHAKLAGGTGNALLRRELERLQNVIWLVRRDNDMLHISAIEGHTSIVNALERDDREQAQDAMRQHIGRIRHALANTESELASAEALMGAARPSSPPALKSAV